MATTTSLQNPVSFSPPTGWRDETLADLVARLGDIPLERIRTAPPLGTAVERDVLEAKQRIGRICELVDGVLVEKTTGTYESVLAGIIIRMLGSFVDERNLGLVTAPDGMLKILPQLVRIPDVAFLSWNRLPPGGRPQDAIWSLAPDLAVEVLSEGNTPGEMRRKLDEYFRSGTRLVWYIDPKTRTARVFTSPESACEIDSQGVLDGGEVLPGFRLPLAEVFARADRKPPEPGQPS